MPAVPETGSESVSRHPDRKEEDHRGKLTTCLRVIAQCVQVVRLAWWLWRHHTALFEWVWDLTGLRDH